MKNLLIFFASLCFCLSAGHTHAASFDWDGDGAKLSKSQRGAYIGFTYKWGGARAPQKYLVMKSFLPTFDVSPVTALTGTAIPFNAIGDLDPRGWSRRNQILTLLGIGTTIWIIENNSHGHSGHHPAPFSDEDDEEDSDEDSDSFPEHCDDGYGEDGEFNNHC